jgi:phosphoheptose isomerase
MTATFELTDPALPPPRARHKFPAARYALASSYSGVYFEQLARAASSIDPAHVDAAAAILVKAYTTGATVMACGNGGSAAIANHLQCDHLKGVRTDTDLSPRVISLSSNVELLTAIANDIGYEDAFVYQLQSHSRPGDVLIAVSSSGRSANIVRALKWARTHDVRTIALTGFEGGDAKTLSEVAIHVDCTNYGIIEDLHQAVMHTLAQFVRQFHMSEEMVSLRTF